MSYLKELQDHYKAVRARIQANAVPEKKPPPKLIPASVEESEEPKSQKAGLAPEGAEAKIVTDALRAVSPEWIGGNHAQAIKIAEEMASLPKLPPLPGLVLNEIGAIRWMRVLHAVAKHHKIPASEIMGRSRKRHVTFARFEVFYRLRVDLNFSYTKIANLMKRDHTSVLHGVNKMRTMLLDANGEARDDGGLAGEHPPARHTPAEASLSG